jgi:hypothetical protein
VATELVANDLTVLVGSRDAGRGEAAAKQIRPGAIALQHDVTDGASIASAAERIRTEFGRLDLLRPYDLGSTQYYVLYQLAHDGPTMQRDLGRTLQIERWTHTGLVATLVREGLVDQTFSPHDQRQRVLRRTDGNTT